MIKSNFNNLKRRKYHNHPSSKTKYFKEVKTFKLIEAEEYKVFQIKMNLQHKVEIYRIHFRNVFN